MSDNSDYGNGLQLQKRKGRVDRGLTPDKDEYSNAKYGAIDEAENHGCSPREGCQSRVVQEDGGVSDVDDVQERIHDLLDTYAERLGDYERHGAEHGLSRGWQGGQLEHEFKWNFPGLVWLMW